MTASDDFSPLVAQGDVEPASGLIDRLRRRQELAPVAAGHVRVLMAEDGMLIPSGRELTGGERRWSRARRWIEVDTSPHALEYAIPFSDPTGRAGFVATITVHCSVRDAAAVASHGIVGVRDQLEPALQRTLNRISSEMTPAGGADPISALTAMRQSADAAVREGLHRPIGDLPEWLTASVSSVTVAFDAETQRHHTQLVESARKGELIDANEGNRQLILRHEMAARAIVRDELMPHLSDPSRRTFEVAFANPTDENIAQVVAQVNNTELALLSRGFDMLMTMVDKDHVDKDDDFYKTIQAISGKLQDLYLRGAVPSLPNPVAPSELDGRADGEDGEPEDQPGDRDWSDQ